jgi:ATP-binding cassette subfamily B protein
MRRRRLLDQKYFSKMAENQSKLIQIIHGIREIKLNNAERLSQWEWKDIQAGLFRVNMKSLSLNQYQEAGGVFINETKNILINVTAAVGRASRGSDTGYSFGNQLYTRSAQRSHRTNDFILPPGPGCQDQPGKGWERSMNRKTNTNARPASRSCPPSKKLTVSKVEFTYPGAIQRKRTGGTSA